MRPGNLRARTCFSSTCSGPGSGWPGAGVMALSLPLTDAACDRFAAAVEAFIALRAPLLT